MLAIIAWLSLALAPAQPSEAAAPPPKTDIPPAKPALPSLLDLARIRREARRAERAARRAERIADWTNIRDDANATAVTAKQPNTLTNTKTTLAPQSNQTRNSEQADTTATKLEKDADTLEKDAKKAVDAAKKLADAATQLRQTATEKRRAATEKRAAETDARARTDAAHKARDSATGREAIALADRQVEEATKAEAAAKTAAQTADQDATSTDEQATTAAKEAETATTTANEKKAAATAAREKADKARAAATELAAIEEAEIDVDCTPMREAKTEATGQSRRRVNRELRRCHRQRDNARIERQILAEKRTFRGALRQGRMARCATAICWGPSGKWALEPMVELPVGRTFSVPRSSLARYLNTNEVQVAFNAGLRVWLWWDWISISTYMSKVLVSGNETVTTTASGFAFAASQIRRPMPGLGIGLFGDMLWLSVDYDQLRNGNSGAAKAPEFLPNEIVSRALTLTVAIAPLAGIRNGIGTLATREQRKKDDARAEAVKNAPIVEEPEPTRPKPTEPTPTNPAPAETTPTPTNSDAPAEDPAPVDTSAPVR